MVYAIRRKYKSMISTLHHSIENGPTARRKQIKSEGAKVSISKWEYHFFNFQSESKKKLKTKGGVLLMLSLFGTFNIQEIFGV